jgi:hypothetical protein
MNKIPNNKIKFHSIVKCIRIPDNEQCVCIEVLRENEELVTYQTKYVVCTQSIGCLKRTMHEMFVPPLPYAKQMSIERLGFGTINKVCLNDVVFFVSQKIGSILLDLSDFFTTILGC